MRNMASILGHHTIEKSVPKNPQQWKENKMPPFMNVVAAASHLRQVFESKKLTYSIMGGFQMFCLGNGREVSDLHFAYDGKDYARIKKKIEADRRIESCEGMNPLTPSKIVVKTGPSYHDPGCTSSVMVEVYLLPSGSYGTPSIGTLKDSVVLLSNNTGGVLRTFNGLNMLYLVKSLIQFCKLRDLSWNPLEDILFLCQHYGGQVQLARNQLNMKATYQNFLNTPFVASLPFNEQRRCYQILAGQAPPAATATHFSSPQNGPLRSHFFQGNQQINKHESLPTHTTNVGLPSRNPPNPSRLSEITPPVGDSRSRYRPISAFNAKRVSSGPQLRINTCIESIEESYKYRKTSAPSHNTPSRPQQADSSTRISETPNALPATLSIQNRRSLTRSGAQRAASRGSYIPGQIQTCQPISMSQKQQHQTHAEIFEMSGTPTQAPIEAQGAYQEEGRKRLQVVGPNGLYQPSSPPPTSAPPPPPSASTRDTNPAPTPQNPVYELESHPKYASDDENDDIIASLAADIESAMTPHSSTLDTLTISTHAASPPSAKRNTLPASLVPGYSSTQAQRPYTPPSEEGEEKKANQASNEKSGLLCPDHDANIGLASPPLTPAPLAVYKAYRPPPLSLPAHAQSRSGSRSRSRSSSPPAVDGAGEAEQQDKHGQGSKTWCSNTLHTGRPMQDARAQVSEAPLLDSSILAMEYQAELPDFDRGYAGCFVST